MLRLIMGIGRIHTKVEEVELNRYAKQKRNLENKEKYVIFQNEFSKNKISISRLSL